MSMNRVYQQKSAMELPVQVKRAINIFVQEARPFLSSYLTVETASGAAFLKYRGETIATKRGGVITIPEGRAKNVQATSYVTHLKHQADHHGVKFVREHTESYHKMWDGPGSEPETTTKEKGVLRFESAIEEVTRFKHIVGVGKVPARLAGEIREGDVLSFPHEQDAYRVTDTQMLSPHRVSITVKGADGKLQTIERMKNSLMGVKRPPAGR
jgi:hypothetical protein